MSTAVPHRILLPVISISRRFGPPRNRMGLLGVSESEVKHTRSRLGIAWENGEYQEGIMSTFPVMVFHLSLCAWMRPHCQGFPSSKNLRSKRRVPDFRKQSPKFSPHAMVTVVHSCGRLRTRSRQATCTDANSCSLETVLSPSALMDWPRISATKFNGMLCTGNSLFLDLEVRAMRFLASSVKAT